MNHAPDTPTVVPPGVVNVWLLKLDLAPAKLEQLHSLLSPDEQQRAARFLRDADRQRFTAARGRLRQILGQYLAADPARVEFSYENHGKPFLKNSPVPIHFNLSHSNGLALLAVSSTSPVGIDIEHARGPEHSLDALGLARRFFSRAEHTAIAAAPNDDDMRKQFFTCWTRKEAFVKALGSGIAGGLDSFDVLNPELPDAAPALFAHRTDPSHVARWALRDLVLPTGFYGALCAHAPLHAAPVLTLP